MSPYFTFGLLAAMFALAGFHRLLARRWKVLPRYPEKDTATPATFEKVWLLTAPPQSKLAYKDRSVGTLSTNPSRADASFEATRGENMTITDVRSVQMGGRGSDFVNTWIEVQYGDAASPSVVFVHDGTWLGWRQMLTGSNWRIARAFATLVG